jgi:hypothetical protein
MTKNKCVRTKKMNKYFLALLSPVLEGKTNDFAVFNLLIIRLIVIF